MQKIIDILDQEVYTRPQVSSYTIKNFEEILESIDFDHFSLEDVQSLLDILQNHMKRISSSPIALFMTVFLKIRMKVEYLQEVNSLFQILNFAKKKSVVLFCAKEFIKKHESKHLLMILANLLERNDSLSSQEELQDVYEKILFKAPSDPKILYKVALIKKKLNNPVESLLYFKAAFSNMLNNHGEFQKEILEIWETFFALQETDFDFFLRSIKIMGKDLSQEKLEYAFKVLYSYITQGDVFIDLQKITLVKEMVCRDCPKDWDFRSILIDLYQKKYLDNTLLQTFLGISQLSQSTVLLQQSIDKFESLIRFDVGAYVFHNSFGYGKIREIIVSSKDKTSADFKIDFQKKQNHTMSLRIATTSLSVFDQNDFFVQKIFAKVNLQMLLQKDLHKFIELLFQSSKNGLTLIQIKNLICPDIISVANWSLYSNKIQQYLKDSPHVILRSKTYSLQFDGENHKDHLLTKIQKESSFDVKLSLIETIFTLYNVTDKDQILITQQLKTGRDISCCNLFRIVKIKDKLVVKTDHVERETLSASSWTDQQIQQGIQKFLGGTRTQFLYSIYTDLTKQKFEQLTKLFYFNSEQSLQIAQSFLEVIFSLSKKDQKFTGSYQEFVHKIYQNYLDHPDDFLAFCKFINEKSFQITSTIHYSDIMLRLVELLGVLHKEMEFPGKQVKAKKQFSTALSMLFDQEKLLSFLHSDESKSVRVPILKLLDQFYFLENYIKIEIKKLTIEFSL